MNGKNQGIMKNGEEPQYHNITQEAASRPEGQGKAEEEGEEGAHLNEALDVKDAPSGRGTLIGL